MKIYTKKGDDGSTGLFYGGRVAKHDPAPEAYGTVDEAVAALAVARAQAPPDIAGRILAVQRELFVVAAELATAPDNRDKLVDEVSRVTQEMVDRLEREIDHLMDEVGLPEGFVVPGQAALPAALDVARAVIRRAERRAVACAAEGLLEGSRAVPYLNRLADYVYMLVRATEERWEPSRPPTEES